MSDSDRRRQPRIPYNGLVWISWEDEDGEERQTRGRCHDITAHGCAVETAELIPMHTRVVLRLVRADVIVNARVRNVRRFPMKVVIGLEVYQTRSRLKNLSESSAEESAELVGATR